MKEALALKKYGVVIKGSKDAGTRTCLDLKPQGSCLTSLCLDFFFFNMGTIIHSARGINQKNILYTKRSAYHVAYGQPFTIVIYCYTAISWKYFKLPVKDVTAWDFPGGPVKDHFPGGPGVS